MKQRNIRNAMSILLGAAFFLQAATSLISGAVFFNPLVVEGDMRATMINLAENYRLAHMSVFLDILTAIVIIVLAVSIYSFVNHINKVMAILALCLYVFEAGLLVVSKFFAYVLIESSMEFAVSGSATLLEMGEMMQMIKGYAYNIHIIPFGIGAMLFYYLIMKSEIMPKWLAMWGLVTVPIVLLGVPLMTYGVPVPFVLLLPYVPFEFIAGIYILVKGIRPASDPLEPLNVSEGRVAVE